MSQANTPNAAQRDTIRTTAITIEAVQADFSKRHAAGEGYQIGEVDEIDCLDPDVTPAEAAENQLWYVVKSSDGVALAITDDGIMVAIGDPDGGSAMAIELDALDYAVKG